MVHQNYTYLGVDDHNITHGRVYGVLTDGELSYAILSPPSLSKRDDGDVYEETKCSSTACNININVVSFLYNTLAPFTSFLDTSSNITLQNISSAIKNYSSDACGYGVLDLASLNDDKWNIAISAFSAADGCGTSATEEEIQCAMTQAITAEQNHKMVAYCVRLDHAGTWNTDVRIQRRRDRPFPGIWNMPCDDVNEDLPVNDYCVAWAI